MIDSLIVIMEIGIMTGLVGVLDIRTPKQTYNR